MSIDERFVDDTMIFSEEASHDVFLFSVVEDAIDMSCLSAFAYIFFDDVSDSFLVAPLPYLIGDDCDCIVLNTSQLHPSVYTGFNFNSMTCFDGDLYAAASDGIYVFDSDLDDGYPFHSGVLLPQTNLSSMSDKRIRKAFVDYTGTGITVSVTADTLGKSSVTKTVSTVKSDFYLPRDLRGKTFEVAIEDFDTLSLIEFFFVTLVR